MKRRMFLVALVLAGCGEPAFTDLPLTLSPVAPEWVVTPEKVIAMVDGVNPADLVVDECLMRSAQIRAEQVAELSAAVHVYRGVTPNEVAAECLPDDWGPGNYIESVYGGGANHPVRIINALLGSPSHAFHITGQGAFADSTRIGVGNVGEWWVIHTAP